MNGEARGGPGGGCAHPRNVGMLGGVGDGRRRRESSGGAAAVVGEEGNGGGDSGLPGSIPLAER